ncbi:MAG TPA: alpha/beta fold hydrolase, partial [Methylocystis sp.]
MDAIDFSNLLWAGGRRRLAREAPGPVIAGGVGEIVETRGASLRVLVAGRKEAQAKTVVIVPDPPNVIEQYASIIEALADRCRVVCVETPGFGASHAKPGFKFDIAGYAAIFAELFEKLDVHDAVLDMACLGGFAGIAFAAAHPERVRHLMLQQTPSITQAQAWAKNTDRLRLIRTPYVGQIFMRSLYGVVTKHWYDVGLAPDAAPEKSKALADPALAILRRGGCFCLCNAYQSLLATPDTPLPAQPRKTTIVF